MKKKITIFVVILLLACVLTVAVKTNHIDIGNDDSIVLDDGLDGFNSPNNGVDFTGYSWTDPVTNIDIFKYENLLSFDNGEKVDFELSSDEGQQMYVNFLELRGDESLTIPEGYFTEGYSKTQHFRIPLCTMSFESDRTYYLYYSEDNGVSWERSIVYSLDAIDIFSLPKLLSFQIGSQKCDYSKEVDGAFTFTGAAPEKASIYLYNGVDGDYNYLFSGTFYLRLIAVPK